MDCSRFRGFIWVQVDRALLLRSDHNFGLADLRQKVLAGAKVLVHQARWGVGKPLTQRNILVLGRREHFKKHQICIADVLDVVRLRLFCVAYGELSVLTRRVPVP